MSLYTALLVVHVIVAVLGVGSVASIVLVAADRKIVSSLLRYSSLSLAAMLLTGILMDLAMRGALHEYWWFRGSAILLVVTGALLGWARRMVRSADSNDSALVLGRIRRIAYGSCALLAAITILMEVKPF